MFFCSYSSYPCNSNPMSTLYTHLAVFVCIMCHHMMFVYYVHLPNACCVHPPLVVPLPPHNPPPSPPSYLHPADLKQMGPPLCAVVLLKVPSSLFLAPAAILLALRGSRLWAL